MRKPISFFTVLVATLLYAQKVTDYRTIMIPETFESKRTNKFGLKNLLTSQLQKKNYTVITDNSSLADPCDGLRAELIDSGNMFTNKVKVEFKNCQNLTVAVYEGKSQEKDFELGMREALQNALKEVGFSQPQKQKIAVDTEPVTIEIIKEEKNNPVKSTPNSAVNTTKKTETKVENKTLSPAQVFNNGKVSVNRINISANQFILANPESSVPYAVFTQSSRKDVYHVQLKDGTKTFGYLENGKIIIEITNPDGTVGKEVFSETR